MKAMTGRVFTNRQTKPIKISLEERLRRKKERHDHFNEERKNYMDCYLENASNRKNFLQGDFNKREING